MGKMVKCKSCGADIAKTARTCPKCGAQQHVAALTFCYLVGIFAIVLCMFILIQAFSGTASGAKPNSDSSGDSVAEQASTENTEDSASPVFSGKHAKVSFLRAYKEDFIDGAFYMVFEIENTSEIKEWIHLTDVYVDDLACYSGSGLPVTVLPRKKANGTFIVFYKGDFDSVKKIEAKIVIADESTLDELESSEEFEIEME